jgi:hypothetical protein
MKKSVFKFSDIIRKKSQPKQSPVSPRKKSNTQLKSGNQLEKEPLRRLKMLSALQASSADRRKSQVEIKL